MRRISISPMRSWQPELLLALCSNKRKTPWHKTFHLAQLRFSPQGDERINSIPQQKLRHKAGRTALKVMHCKANKVQGESPFTLDHDNSIKTRIKRNYHSTYARLFS